MIDYKDIRRQDIVIHSEHGRCQVFDIVCNLVDGGLVLIALIPLEGEAKKEIDHLEESIVLQPGPDGVWKKVEGPFLLTEKDCTKMTLEINTREQ